MPTTTELHHQQLCQSCGACCDYAPDWPRFSIESEEALDMIPAALVDPSLSRMAAVGNRCAALTGKVGEAVACSVYAIRPAVCRDCMPGDDACAMARARHGLSPVPVSELGS